MPPQNLLFALCYLHIVLLIYWDKESYVPKGLQFAKNSDNFCVTTHSSYMLTRHPLSTSETINENGKKKNLYYQLAVGKLIQRVLEPVISRTVYRVAATSLSSSSRGKE